MGEYCLRRSIGLADSCELASAIFAFPEKTLVSALIDGSLQSDACACLLDAGAEDSELEHTRSLFAPFAESDEASLYSSLRKGHTILYLTPGTDVPVWPYEAAFCHTAEHREGTPSLFRSRCVLDVERSMREAGVLPKTARQEPSDSVWNEFSFLSYLYGNRASCMQENLCDDASVWNTRIVRFWNDHAKKWLCDFMDETQRQAPRQTFGAEYGVFASFARLVLDKIEADIEHREAVMSA